MSTSTTSTNATKGEKGKSKYAALNINSLYTGNQIEPQTKTVPPKHGMQSLGKVPTARRAPQPVNLPSLKSESGGTVQESNTQSSSAQNPGWTGSVPEVNSNVKQTTQSQSPQPAAVAPAVTPPVSASGTSRPVAQQPGRSSTDQITLMERKFEQDFPSLTADTGRTEGQSQTTGKKAVVTQPTATAEISQPQSPQPLQYGPGPSLRPQTEGSWVQGGRGSSTHPQPTQNLQGGVDGLPGQAAGAMPQGPGGQAGAPTTGTGPRSGPVPGHPQLMGPAPPPHAVRSVMPPFMFSAGGPVPPSSYPRPYQGPYGPRGPGGAPGGRNPPPQQDSRFRMVQRMPTPQNQGDAEIYPRPIIKEEDLRRMDEIARDDGWASMQDELDYDKKLFDDEEEVKERAKSVEEDTSKKERNGKWADNIQAQGRALSSNIDQNIANTGRQRYQPVSRTTQQPPHSIGSRSMNLDDDDFWREKCRQQKDEENKAMQKARERREEEERRFELSKQQTLERPHSRDAVESRRSSSSSRDRHDEERDKHDWRGAAQRGNERSYGYDTHSRNAPNQHPIAPRFLKQKQQQANFSNRVEEERLPSQPQKEIRLARDRDERRHERDRYPYDPPSRDRQQEVDREDHYKRNYDKERAPDIWQRDRENEKRGHRSDPVRDWSDKPSEINLRRKDRNDHDTESKEEKDRPDSRDSRSSNKEVQIKDDREKTPQLLFPLQASTDISSWADEPPEYEDENLPPINISVEERRYSDDRRTHPTGNKSVSHHAPAPIPRDKLEADVRSEPKSNFVPLRRHQSSNNPNYSSSNSASTTAQELEKKRASEAVVENVWLNRTKSREQQEQPKTDEKENDEKHVAENADNKPQDAIENAIDKSSDLDQESLGDDKNRKVINKENRNRGTRTKVSTNYRTGGAGPRRRGPLQSRYSDSYDDYFSEDENDSPYHQDTLDDRKIDHQSKSKSPDQDDGRKGDKRNRVPLRGGRRGIGRGYEDEDPRSKEAQRPPRFSQQEDKNHLRNKGRSGPLTHQSSQDLNAETWESHSEHSGSDAAACGNRSNRRGKGNGGDRRIRNERGKGEHTSQSDLPKSSDAPQPADIGTNDAVSCPADDMLKDQSRKSIVKDRDKPRQVHLSQHDESKRPRREKENNKDRYRTNKIGGIFDNRSSRQNLPPRLANRLKPHKPDSDTLDTNSTISTKTITPPPQQTGVWEKPGSSTTSSLATPSLTVVSSAEITTTTQLAMTEENVSEIEEKPILDGTTPPVQTIIFENTNYKGAAVSLTSDLKGAKCSSSQGQLQKSVAKTQSDAKTGKSEGLQLPVSVEKEDMQLNLSSFAYGLNGTESSKAAAVASAPSVSATGHGLQPPVGSKIGVSLPRGIPHSVISAGVQSPISPSAELNMKIASVKKVWYSDTTSAMPTVMEHSEDPNGQVTSGSAQSGGFPSSFDSDASSNVAGTTEAGDVYSTGSPLQQQAKMDNSSVTNVCKVKPQQQTVIGPSAGPISPSSTFSSSTAPVCNTSSAAVTPSSLGTGSGPIGYHNQYTGIPAVPSPPTVMFNSAAQQIPTQPGIYQPFQLDNSQFSLLQVLNAPNQVRSQFSQYAAFGLSGLSQGLGQMGNIGNLSNLSNPAAAAFGQQSIFLQQPPPSPAAPPAGPTPGPGAPGPAPPVAHDLYQSSVSTQYRLQNHAPFGQSQHTTAGPMLIPSNNSLVNVKSAQNFGSGGQPNFGSIGTKTGSPYQQQPSGHQHSQVYFPYDPNQQVLNLGQVNLGGQSYLPSSQLLQQRTAPPPVQAIQPPPSSFYSAGPAAAGTGNNQTGFYQPTGAPNLQQVPPAAPGQFSIAGFASQASLQGYTSRSAQQQPTQQQLNQLAVGGRYCNGPGLNSQAPLGGLPFAKQMPPTPGASPAPGPSPVQYMSARIDNLGAQNTGGGDMASKIDNGHQHGSSNTSPKARNKTQHQVQQQQVHQINKFPNNSNSSGAYPGPPIRAPGFPAVRAGPPPSSPSNSSNLIGPGSNPPRYPNPIQRPTTVNNPNNATMVPTGPPGAGIGVRPRAPNPHPARTPGAGTAPGQPQLKTTGATPAPLSQPFSSSHAGTSNDKSSSVAGSIPGDEQQQRKGSSPSTENEQKNSSSGVGAASETVEKENSATKAESAASK